MPKKGQVIVIDGVLSLLMAIILAYILFAAWPRNTHPTSQLALERAGYDIVNAFYYDEGIHQTMQKGLEVKGYLSPEEINYLRQRLYNYGRILGVARMDVEVDGSTSFSVVVSNSPLTSEDQFSVILPLKNGADTKVVRVSIWE